jgi:serine protease Do
MTVQLRPLWPAALLFFLLACTDGTPESANADEPALQVAAPEVARGSDPAVAAALPNFAALVEAYGPAVVNVSTVGRQQPVAAPPGVSPDDPLFEFFRRFGMPEQDGRMPIPRGEGSGFVISKDGYILTNAHVVENASDVTVRMTDRREYSAKVVGVDPLTDVAVLKIEAEDLPVVRTGSAESVKPGQWVFAIGSPFGFENSVTAGIVSATARALPSDTPYAYTGFIQTDVAVNFGNSGGPLFNLEGEVIGINSQIYSRTGGYQGISFAIPIDVAINVKDQLVASGRVQRGRIGVTIQEVDQALADSFNLSRPRGALVNDVEEGAPADEAGLESGDVILAVNGNEIERSSELPAIVAAVKPGDEATLTIWRDGSERKIRVEVEELQAEPRVARVDRSAGGETGKLGLAVRQLTDDERAALRTDGRLVVENSEGPAAIAGLQPGDVLIAVNGVPVENIGQFRKAVDSSDGSVALLIQRRDAKFHVPVRIDS